MRHSLITASLIALMASSAQAADIMSCSFDTMPPPPPRMGPPPGVPSPATTQSKNVKPGEKPAPTVAGAPVPPPGGPGAPPPGARPPGGPGTPPPPPPRQLPPSVDAKLNCISGATKGESSLSELSAKGWKLQTSATTPAGITFYLVK